MIVVSIRVNTIEMLFSKIIFLYALLDLRCFFSYPLDFFAIVDYTREFEAVKHVRNQSVGHRS